MATGMPSRSPTERGCMTLLDETTLGWTNFATAHANHSPFDTYGNRSEMTCTVPIHAWQRTRVHALGCASAITTTPALELLVDMGLCRGRWLLEPAARRTAVRI